MPLYPTFEDLKVEELLKEQTKALQDGSAAARLSYTEAASFMGLALESYHYNDQGELVTGQPPAKKAESHAVVPAPSSTGSQAIVPSIGPKGEIQQGLRGVTLCKDVKGKVGLQLLSVDTGVFVSFVEKGSPAALGGMRFGDQIISICDKLVAGFSGNKAMKLLKKSPVNDIILIVRDRPFERTLMLQKNSSGEIGLHIENGAIKSIVKDSSAARNGVLTGHQIVEINGQNVIGLKDKELRELLNNSPPPIRFTIIPSPIFYHMIKNLSRGVIRHEMDHSIADV